MGEQVLMSAQSSSRPFLLNFWNILKIILAVVLIGLVLSKTDLSQLLALKGQVSIPWLLISLALYILLTLLKAAQYYFLIGRRAGYPQILNIVVIQNAISNFFATGAGVASYLTLLRVEEGVKFSRSAIAFVLAKVGDLISIWLFLIATVIWVWPQIELLQNLVSLVLFGISAGVLAFFLLIIFRRRCVSVIGKLIESLKLDHNRVISKGFEILMTLADQEQAFVFRVVGISILFSLVYMFVTMAWIYAGFLTFSFNIEILPMLFVNTFMQLISYLPVQVFGGLGVNEAAMLYLYGFFKFSQTPLATLLVGQRMLFYVMNLFVLVYLPVYAVWFSHRTDNKIL